MSAKESFSIIIGILMLMLSVFFYQVKLSEEKYISVDVKIKEFNIVEQVSKASMTPEFQKHIEIVIEDLKTSKTSDAVIIQKGMVLTGLPSSLGIPFVHSYDELLERYGKYQSVQGWKSGGIYYLGKSDPNQFKAPLYLGIAALLSAGFFAFRRKKASQTV